VRVGITYDLRDDYLAEGYTEEQVAEFDKPETVDGIEQALRALGHETVRIGHVRNLVKRLAAGERWDFVFNIAEGVAGFGREAQVPALLDAYGIPYTFSGPMVLALCLHKGLTKQIVRDLGAPTPDFALVTTEDGIKQVRLGYPVFAKPVAEGTGKGISRNSLVNNAEELDRVCRALLAEFAQPVLVEDYMPGREFTAGIVGTGSKARIIGVMEVQFTAEAEGDVYSYINKEKYQGRVQYRLVSDAEAQEAGRVALVAWRGLECQDAGRIDLRSDEDGRPNFLEVNPLAGLHPVHSDLPIICRLAGISFTELIRMILESALRRENRE
jgi:D-alanine-D-alanine ligase